MLPQDADPPCGARSTAGCPGSFPRMREGAFTFQVQHLASMSGGPILHKACGALWKWRRVEKPSRPNRTFPHCLEIRYFGPDFHIPTAPATALAFSG
jgi:hypothetical protein